MLRKEKFIPGEYYHIYSRTILHTPEFKDSKNSKKLAQAFLIANSTESSKAFDYLRTDRNANFEKVKEIIKKGKKLVDVLCYAIMPDHYHLLLRELTNGGITVFAHKCNTSVSKYVNQKQNRMGPLFESRFKSKLIGSNEYLLHLSLYIHLNPLDIISGRGWRENKLKNWHNAKKELLLYPWSSLKSFLKPNGQDLILSGTEIILNQFKDRKDYELFLREWAGPIDDKLKDILID